MVNPDKAKTVSFKSPKDLGKWLQVNHAAESEFWVKIFKKGSGVPSVTWNEVVIETLCWSWIDGVDPFVLANVPTLDGEDHPGDRW